METTKKPRPRLGNFLPADFTISGWETILPFCEELLERDLDTIGALKTWISDRNQLEAFLSEEMRWKYIKTSIDTQDQEAKKDLEFYFKEISPEWDVYRNKLDLQFQSSELRSQLSYDEYGIYLKRSQAAFDLFNKDNVELSSRQKLLQSKYGSITGALQIEHKGQTLTIQQASKLLKHPDREQREAAFRKIDSAWLAVEDQLEDLMDELVSIRHQMAVNAGFENYRDYKFKELCRFDYSAKNCFEFHEAIADHIIPIMAGLQEERKEKLRLEVLRPWDTQVDPDGRPALTPFSGESELIEKSIEILAEVDPFFGSCLKQMQEIGHLDLASRVGKAPGGYNMPLPETGIPFIFMNAVGSERDVKTLMHEAGHAIHSFLAKPIELLQMRYPTSEMAEVASMAMELFSLDHWNLFYTKQEDFRIAKRNQYVDVLSTFGKVGAVDAFQHWMYENPGHSREERKLKWAEMHKKFLSQSIDWNEFEHSKSLMWHRILHIFEVPFYFVEYGIAQLGAIAMYQNFKENPQKAIADYTKALSLGYSVSMPELYETGGIRFDLSSDYVMKQAHFMRKQLADLVEQRDKTY